MFDLEDLKNKMKLSPTLSLPKFKKIRINKTNVPPDPADLAQNK